MIAMVVMVVMVEIAMVEIAMVEVAVMTGTSKQHKSIFYIIPTHPILSYTHPSILLRHVSLLSEMTVILVVIAIAMTVETPVTIEVGPVAADAIAVVPEKEIVVDMTVTGNSSLFSSRRSSPIMILLPFLTLIYSYHSVEYSQPFYPCNNIYTRMISQFLSGLSTCKQKGS